MKEVYLKVLEKSELFSGFNIEEIDDLLNQRSYSTKTYDKNELIASEGDTIKKLAIVLSGEISIEKSYINGKIIKVKSIKQGELIAHANVFSDYNTYQSTVMASSNAVLLFITQENTIKICADNTRFLNNFMRLISNQTVYLSNKLKFFSYSSIRKKIIYYILEEFKKQNSLKIKESLTRKQLAETFGVTRPALSNELIKMKNDGLINYEKGTIIINSIDELENEVFNL